MGNTGKRVVGIILVVMLVHILMGVLNYHVKATGEFDIIELTVFEKTEDYELYLLLPAEYIERAILKSEQDISYEGAKTLIENDISTIPVSKGNVQTSSYVENDIEYIQIRLDSKNEVYTFSMLQNYPVEKLKFRITSKTSDMILHLEGFQKQKNGICVMEYNYQKQTIKNMIKTEGIVHWWQVIVAVIIIFAMAYIMKQRSR